ncbi:hypothetical protein TWF694_010551 [Orbilia ellipsospora]|uniref:Low temperature requirement A n=1 Tax=Orbilia ellipsospora TaxID=2528407 RepID=A0AAV9XA84_9PEZI
MTSYTVRKVPAADANEYEDWYHTREDVHGGVRDKRDQQRIPAVAVPLEEKRPGEQIPTSALVDGVGKIWSRHAEATWLELFYDLFFVANLTTFTDSHQINDRDTLQSYIGFFAILWFTWLQAALFDLRFGKDSIIQRVAKGLQIGVMVGFSAVNSKFDPRYPHRNHEAFKALSFLLFGSRFSIAIQYFVVWWTVKQYKKTKWPLLLMSVLMCASMLCFLGLAFSFTRHSNTKGYIGWYVVLALEAVLVLAISLKWRIVGFKGTHLIQRMGLLTLIVMGEGIIGLCRATNLISEGVGAASWSARITGQAISGILCIYFIYMLYFDDEPNYVYSSVPQQVWAILHFPFHLGIVLFIEGQQQLMIWQGIISGLEVLGDRLVAAYWEGGRDNGDLIANLVLQVIDGFFPDDTADAVANEPAFVFNLAPMRDSNDPVYITEQIDKLWDLCAYAIFNGFSVQAPVTTGEFYNSDRKFEGFSNIYHLVLIYFFVSAGVLLVILAIFTYLMKWPKDRFEWLHITYRLVFGVTIGLIALVATNGIMLDNFLTSPWVVPMMMMLLLALLIIDKLTILSAFRYSERKVNRQRSLKDDERGGLISTSVSSVTPPPPSSSSSSPSSSSSSGSALPPMPGADNSLPPESNNGFVEESTSSSSFGGYPYATPPRTSSHTPNFSRRNSRDNYYAGASQLEQVEEVLDEDNPNAQLQERSPVEEPEPPSPFPPTGLHVTNPSIHPSTPSHHTATSTSVTSSLPSRHVHHQEHIPITNRAFYSPAPAHLRNYNSFTSPPTPPLGSTFYEVHNVSHYQPQYNHPPNQRYEEHRESLKSPVTVIRRASFDSLETSNSGFGIGNFNTNKESRRLSSLDLSRGERVSVDMPQTHRGFMASPVGFVEGEQGRVDVNGGRKSRNRGRSRKRHGGVFDKGARERDIGGIGRFMMSTESMMGVRQ